MSNIIAQHGNLTYAILWAIVFCETGLVLTPFLPGDSLLFAAGAFAGKSMWLDASIIDWQHFNLSENEKLNCTRASGLM